MTPQTSANNVLAVLPISRGRAINRALLRLIPAVVMLMIASNVFSGLNLTPTAVSNRITDYSKLILILPLALGGLLIGLNGARWLITACWPGELGVVASTKGITLHLGAMASPHYPIDALTIRYLFEMDTDELDEDLIYEALQPPEKQMAEMLPRIYVTGEREPLNNQLIQLCSGNEAQLAAALKPFVDFHRPNIEWDDDDDDE